MRKEKFIEGIVLNLLFGFVLILLFCSCGINREVNSTRSEAIKVALFRTSTEIYLFDIDPEGQLMIYHGDRYWDDFTNPENISIVEQEKIALNDEQLDLFRKKINDIEDWKGENFIEYDTWQVVVKYTGNTYEGRLNDIKTHEVNEIVAMLIEYSSFEILGDRWGRETDGDVHFSSHFTK